MTKLKLWLGVLVALMLLAAACGEDQPAETTAAGPVTGELPDLGGREVTIAVENFYLPFNYIDPDTGEATGWDYDTWAAICELLNCKPVFVEAAWEGMIQAVADGQYDAAADGITITPERGEIVDFSNGYMSVEQQLITRLDEDRFSTLDEFAAGTWIIGTQTGTTNYETAVGFVGADRVSAFDTFPFAVQALINGDVDAVIIDNTAGVGYVGENKDAIKLMDGSLSSDQLGFIYPKGSDLREPVNRALSEMAANGTLEDLAEKYFSGAFTISYEDLEG